MTSVSICLFKSEPSFEVIEQAITGLETPQARPKASLDSTNTYGLFLSSHSNGKCSRISKGSASAAITINSATPRLSVLVASFAPFFNCLWFEAWFTSSNIFLLISLSASGKALGSISLVSVIADGYVSLSTKCNGPLSIFGISLTEAKPKTLFHNNLPPGETRRNHGGSCGAEPTYAAPCEESGSSGRRG